MRQPKVALVCDWLTNFGGAERVIEQFHLMFPEAPIFTSLYVPEKMSAFKNADVRTSYLQKIPGARYKHQFFLSFYPRVFESFDLSEYDIVISSSHSCAKGVVTKPSTLHICYCHSPMRYAWDGAHQFIKDYPLNSLLKNFIVPPLIHKLRIWDRMSADRVDYYLANSKLVQSRIEKYYRRDSEVLNPPVDTKQWSGSGFDGGYYLAVGRMTPYKRFDLLVEAFNELGDDLVLVGEGPDFERLKGMAKENIRFMGRVSDEELLGVYLGARAFLFPQYEDFGITPLEAMSCGKPVIAYKKGGSLDTVVAGKTGVFFKEQTVDSLLKAINGFEEKEFDPEVIRKYAEKFGSEIFRERMFDFVNQKWESWQKEML